MSALAREPTPQRPRVCMITVLTPVNAVILNEARSLVASGREVTLLAVGEGREPAGPEGVEVRHMPLLTRRLPKAPAAWAVKYAEALLRLAWAAGCARADLYEAHDIDALLPAWMVARLRRKKLLFNAHELWTEQPGIPARRLWRRLERALIPRADAVLCPEEDRADILFREYGARQRPVVVANCGPFSPVERTDRLPRFLEERGVRGRRIVLYQGGLAPDRCCEELVEAFTHVEADAALVLMGSGSPGYLARLQAIVADLGLEDQVLFHPPVPLDEVMACTASADVGVALYRNNGRNNYHCAPTKLSEYWLAGLPAIVPDFPGMRALVGENGLGLLVDPESPRDIARAVDRLLSDDELYRRLSGRARWFVENSYNWQRQSDKLLAVYDRLLGEPRPGRPGTGTAGATP